MDETKLAEEIVGILDAVTMRECSDDRENLRFAVRGPLKLRSVVFRRSALRRLLHERIGSVKIEYLKRDLLRAAPYRTEYVYPRRSALNPKHEIQLASAIR